MEQKTQKKKSGVVVIAIILVIAIVVGLVVYFRSKSGGPTDNGGILGGIFDGGGQDYVRVDENGNENKKGNYIRFGSYPQSQVTDTDTITQLNAQAGALPKNGSNGNWTSYKYYILNSNDVDFMWYIDLTANGNKYRGVYFDQYRPSHTKFEPPTMLGYQKTHGFYLKQTYWFSYDPILWKIIDTQTVSGDTYATLFCASAIDAQTFQTSAVQKSNGECVVVDQTGKEIKDESGESIYANNYEYSSIRKWLNETFYRMAFQKSQQNRIQVTEIDNSETTTRAILTDGKNKYACKNTQDKVWLLSFQDTINSVYGFSREHYNEDYARIRRASAYACCQGSYTDSGAYGELSNDMSRCIWLLRSPNPSSYVYKSAGDSSAVDNDGYSSLRWYNSTAGGICPALKIKL